jgi:hypothetical protein
MPKKQHRHSSAQHRPQPKKKDVMLVRTSASTEVVEVAEEEETDARETTEAMKPGTAKPKPASAPAKATAPALPAGVKRPGITPKPGAQPTRVLPASQRAGRPVPRGPRVTVGRQANLVSAEHYRYVLKDLRLIGILAALMFSVLIALTFILPHVLNY